MTASDEGRGNPVERLVELAVFAPVGLLLTAREELPELVEKGRTHLGSQLTVARMVGELALGRGQKMADKWVSTTLERLKESSGTGSPTRNQDPVSDTSTPYTRAPGVSDEPAAAAARDLARTRSDVLALDPGRLRPRPLDAAGLPIPGYDSLSASQVVQRLPGLTADELDAVRAYEQAGRGRKTILVRVAQLRAVS